MTEQEEQIAQEAVKWIRRGKNKRFILEEFASLDRFMKVSAPMILFTAGSPGAGKTEFLKNMRESFIELFGQSPVVIDPDTIRQFLPGYTGSNSYLFQKAVSIAVDDLFRHVVRNKLSAFIDGTFSNYKLSHHNIETVVNNYGKAMISYVFQNPPIAWHFTQLRESVEGRNIQQKDFIDKFLSAKVTVDKIKREFGDRVRLDVIQKDYKDTEENKRIANVFTNIDSIEECLSFNYSKASIKRLL